MDVLRFDFEVLKARLDIRNFFLQFTVRQIYENVAQVLSLVRMQLGAAKPVASVAAANDLVTSGDLVGHSIRELRTMSKSLYPDEDILCESGLKIALQQAVYITNPGSKIVVGSLASELDIPAGIKLLTFKLVMEVLISIQQMRGAITNLSFTVSSNKMMAQIIFTSQVKYNNFAADQLEYILQNEATKLLHPIVDVKNINANETAIQLNVPF